MRRRRLAAGRLVAVAAAGLVLAVPGQARADDPPIKVSGGFGAINTTIQVPGSPGTAKAIVQPVGGGTAAGPAVSCTYTFVGAHGADALPSTFPDVPGGRWAYRACSDGTSDVVWVPDSAAAAAGAPPGVPRLTAAQLALEARDLLVLTHPTVHRSPVETGSYQGDPFTWANLWTWFWSDPADYQPISHTVSVGAVSATVVATPVGLLFDPGDDGDPVRCVGPGAAWTDADGNDAPASGCGYRYRHVTDGTIISRLGILWRVAWTAGTGGTGGTLPTMETVTAAPLRVLQVQVVNR